ncbi:glutaredoxin 3 [Spongiibacter sp.]|uniref:glutaredoxin 3 n=1 Tax=Spongiibacter sp. TaxID=2024860 RepID=UPI003566C87B
MSAVTIYTTRFCPYCVRAKQLLSSKQVHFTEVPVDGRNDLRQDLLSRTGQRTVPQIWVGDTHVGGCDELFALERGGKLDAMLAAS